MLGGLKAVLLSSLVGRLYYLQVIESKKYKTFSDSNRIRDFLLPPLRGRILDRSGRFLAVNQNYYRILYDPLSARHLDKTLTLLGDLLAFTDERRARMKAAIRAHRSRNTLMLHEHLTWDEVAKVEVNLPNLPGISIDMGQIRYFPMKTLSPHVIGYLGPVSEKEIRQNSLLNHPDFKVGISGLEKSYDHLLRGDAGYRRMEVDAYGKSVEELSRQESKAGNDLYLTLDKRLQDYTSTRLSGNSGSAVVLDIDTGAILTMASTPGFDPNQFTYGITKEYWEELTENDTHPLTNKALSHQYPPGSTFKLVVALAALEAGIIDPDKTIFCPGHVTLGRRRFHCWKEEGHGNMNFIDAIMHSCNSYFFTISGKVGVEKIAAMARLLGLGQTYDIGVSHQKLVWSRISNGNAIRFSNPGKWGIPIMLVSVKVMF